MKKIFLIFLLFLIATQVSMAACPETIEMTKKTLIENGLATEDALATLTTKELMRLWNSDESQFVFQIKPNFEDVVNKRLDDLALFDPEQAKNLAGRRNEIITQLLQWALEAQFIQKKKIVNELKTKTFDDIINNAAYVDVTGKTTLFRTKLADKDVVIKVLHPDLPPAIAEALYDGYANTASRLEALLRQPENRAYRKHILPYYGDALLGDKKTLVFGYVEGTPLSQIHPTEISKFTTPEQFSKLINFVEKANKAGIFHTAISANDIIITPDGTLVLVGWGQNAKLVQGIQYNDNSALSRLRNHFFRQSFTGEVKHPLDLFFNHVRLNKEIDPAMRSYAAQAYTALYEKYVKHSLDWDLPTVVVKNINLDRKERSGKVLGVTKSKEGRIELDEVLLNEPFQAFKTAFHEVLHWHQRNMPIIVYRKSYQEVAWHDQLMETVADIGGLIMTYDVAVKEQLDFIDIMGKRVSDYSYVDIYSSIIADFMSISSSTSQEKARHAHSGRKTVLSLGALVGSYRIFADVTGTFINPDDIAPAFEYKKQLVEGKLDPLKEVNDLTKKVKEYNLDVEGGRSGYDALFSIVTGKLLLALDELMQRGQKEKALSLAQTIKEEMTRHELKTKRLPTGTLQGIDFVNALSVPETPGWTLLRKGVSSGYYTKDITPQRK